MTSEKPIAEDAPLYADWIGRALRSSGYQADFSLESLHEIDRFFDEQAPNCVVKPGGLLAEDFGKRIFAIGCYIGEVMRRITGGEWEGDDSDPAAEFNLAVRLNGDRIIWPTQRAIKRCKLGEEEGVYAYGFLLLRRPKVPFERGT